MSTEAVHRSNPPINAKDFGVPAEFAECAENYAQWAIAIERNRMLFDGWRQCAKGQRTTQFCAVAEQARLGEREAAVLAAGSTLQAQGVDWPITEQVIRNIRTQATDRLARHGIQTPEDDEDANPSF